MQIDVEKLEELIERADGLFFSEEADEVLVKFLKIKQQVENAEKAIKAKIEETGCRLASEFKGIEGKHVSVRYQSAGAKYEIDMDYIAEIPASLYKTKFLPDSKAIDTFKQDNGAVPEGVVERERKKSIFLRVKSS